MTQVPEHARSGGVTVGDVLPPLAGPGAYWSTYGASSDAARETARAGLYVLDRGPAAGVDPDNVAATVSFADGSLGTVLYVSQGHTGLGKERVEIFGGGQSIVIDDFATLDVHGVSGQKGERRRTVEKGHYELLAHFHQAVTGAGALEITGEDGYWATWCAAAARRSLQDGA